MWWHLFSWSLRGFWRQQCRRCWGRLSWEGRLLWDGEWAVGFRWALIWRHVDVASTCLVSFAEDLEQYALSCPTSQCQQLLKAEEGEQGWERGEETGLRQGPAGHGCHTSRDTAASNETVHLDLRVTVLKSQQTLPFQFFLEVSPWALPIWTLCGQGDCILLWEFLPLTAEWNDFGLSIWCRVEEGLRHYVNEKNDSIYC